MYDSNVVIYFWMILILQLVLKMLRKKKRVYDHSFLFCFKYKIFDTFILTKGPLHGEALCYSNNRIWIFSEYLGRSSNCQVTSTFVYEFDSFFWVRASDICPTGYLKPTIMFQLMWFQSHSKLAHWTLFSYYIYKMSQRKLTYVNHA